MFKMLGNWSIGEYFKKEAIEWAWEFLIDELKIDPTDLYATVFEGDKKEGLEPDTEAFNEWKKYLPEEKERNPILKNVCSPLLFRPANLLPLLDIGLLYFYFLP